MRQPYGAVAVLNLGRPQPQYLDSGEQRAVTALAFSPDGVTLAVGLGSPTQRDTANDEPAEVALWDVPADSPRATLKGHSGPVFSIAFSPDGRTVATGSYDYSVRLWEAHDGAPLAELLGHTGTVFGVAFSPDGRLLASGSYDRTVRLWHAATDDWIADQEAAELVTTISPTIPNKAEIVQAIERNLTSSLEARVRALRRVAELPNDRQREAVRLVDLLSGETPLRSEVVQRLRADAAISAPTRDLALQLAEKLEDDVDQLDCLCWLAVLEPNLDPEAYRQALAYAEAACRLQPQWRRLLCAWGAAEYRSGHYAEALKPLLQAQEYYRSTLGEEHPINLAFLALTHLRLGDSTAAATCLETLPKIASQPAWRASLHLRKLCEEANLLLKAPKSSKENTRRPSL